MRFKLTLTKYRGLLKMYHPAASLAKWAAVMNASNGRLSHLYHLLIFLGKNFLFKGVYLHSSILGNQPSQYFGYVGEMIYFLGGCHLED